MWSTSLKIGFWYFFLGSEIYFLYIIDLFCAYQILIKRFLSSILKSLLGSEIFFLLLGYPMANFGPLSRGQPHYPNVNHYIFNPYFDPKVRSFVTWLDPKVGGVHIGVRIGIRPLRSQRFDPLGHSPFIWEERQWDSASTSDRKISCRHY